jgi:hypothetical protein
LGAKKKGNEDIGLSNFLYFAKLGVPAHIWILYKNFIGTGSF